MTIQNQAFLLGALMRQAVWCMEFCFYLEWKNGKGLRLGSWPGIDRGIREFCVLTYYIFVCSSLSRQSTRLRVLKLASEGTVCGTHWSRSLLWGGRESWKFAWIAWDWHRVTVDVGVEWGELCNWVWFLEIMFPCESFVHFVPLWTFDLPSALTSSGSGG